ncbi:MAG: cysteine desulfurase [Pedosphaera sp.]|nr:cysteine desulfurase [Pedosphaera sp.]
MTPIYFDYNATTPLDLGVRQAMDPYLQGFWGNPSSIHSIGRHARAALDEARYRMASAWACRPSEVVFTGGGTESNNLAILGTARLLKSKGRHLVTSRIEHHAVLHAFQYLQQNEGFDVTFLPVDSNGRLDVGQVLSSLRSDTVLVSVMAANNEVGTLQPVAEIGSLCRERGVLFHCDAVQAFGKVSFRDIHQFEADLVSVCAHKFHGPRGTGALFIRSPLLPHPIQHGGAQENERRGGTENIAAIVGLVEAFERCVVQPAFPEASLREWTTWLADRLVQISGVVIRGDSSKRLSNTLSFTVLGTDSIALLANLDLEGVCASSGSACTAGSVEPSHVLKAMGVPDSEANALIRFSLGRENNFDQVRHVAEIVADSVKRIRR